MKGKFKNKLLIVLGHPIAAGIVKSIPFGLGSLAANLLDSVNGTKAGEVDKKTLAPIILKMVFYALIALAVAKGWLSAEEAEAVRGGIG